LLYHKLRDDVFDAGRTFAFEEASRPELSKYCLVVKKEQLDRDSDVFLIDHAWATTSNDPYQLLLMDSSLLARMAKIVNVPFDEDSNLSIADKEPSSAKPEVPEHLTPEEWADMVQMVVQSGNVSEDQAKDLLHKENYEVLNAIVEATYIEEDTPQLRAIKEQIASQAQ
ncbi:hypothetical protein H4R33_007221, partial [Dimargaris cristalligena]